MNVVVLLYCKEFHSQQAQHILPVQDWSLDGWFDEFFKVLFQRYTVAMVLIHLFPSRGQMVPSSMFLNSSLQISTAPFYRIIGSNNHMIIFARDNTLG
jgi:hypothetical protein